MSTIGLESSSLDSPLTTKHHIKENEKINNLTIQIKLSEINYNNDLTKLLAYCKPTKSQSKSSQSSNALNPLTSSVRGLITKHNELVRCLDSISDPNFYLYFVVWLNEAYTIYEKYITNFHYSSNKDEIYLKPINRLKFFIDLINQLLIILQKNLNSSLSDSFNELLVNYFKLLDKFDHKYNTQKLEYQLDSISFNNVKNLVTFDQLSSFFKTSSILKRDFFNLSIKHPLGNSTTKIELILLNNMSKEAQIINDVIELSKIDGLALCSIKKESNDTLVRSLMFPPFRINELSIVSLDSHEIILTPVLMSSLSNLLTPLNSDFKFEQDSDNEILLKITCETNKLSNWFEYIKILFPFENENFNINYNSTFMKTFNTLKDLKYNGLGIQIQENRYPMGTNFKNPITKSTPKRIDTTPKIMKRSKKNITPPKYQVARIQTPPTIKEEDEEEEEELVESSEEFNFISKNESPIPVKKFIETEEEDDNDSPKQRRSTEETVDASEICELKQDVNKEETKVKSILKNQSVSNVASRRSSIYKTDASMSLSALLDERSESPLALSRPPQSIMCHSNNSLHSVGSVDSEQPIQQESRTRFSSVPNLYEIDEPIGNSVYQSRNFTSSNIDISNFGKDFKPDFNFNKSKKDKRKSVFDFFKKKPASKKVGGFEIVENINNLEEEKLNNNLEKLSIKKPKESTSSKRNIQKLTVQTGLLGPPSIFKSGNKSSPLSASTIYDSTSSLPSPFSLTSIPEDDNTKIKLSNEIKNIIDISPEIFNGVSKISQWKVNKWEKVTEKYLYLRIFLNLDQGLILGYETDTNNLDDIDIDNDDRPSIVLFLDTSSSIQKSNALDIQINSKDSSGKSNLYLIRCNSSTETEDLLKNLNFAINDNQTNLSNSKKQFSTDTIKSNFSMNSSIMSKQDKNHTTSQSSTLTNISSINNIQELEFLKPPNSASQSNHIESPMSARSMDSFASPLSSSSSSAPPHKMKESSSNKEQLLLLSSTKIRLHKQLKSYAHINDSKTWKTIGMSRLQLYSIVSQPGSYQLIIDDSIDCTINKFQIERIGKAGLLVKIPKEEISLDDNNDTIYMVETKGKKQATYLYDLINYEIKK